MIILALNVYFKRLSKFITYVTYTKKKGTEYMITFVGSI